MFVNQTCIWCIMLVRANEWCRYISANSSLYVYSHGAYHCYVFIVRCVSWPSVAELSVAIFHLSFNHYCVFCLWMSYILYSSFVCMMLFALWSLSFIVSSSLINMWRALAFSMRDCLGQTYMVQFIEVKPSTGYYSRDSFYITLYWPLKMFLKALT